MDKLYLNVIRYLITATPSPTQKEFLKEFSASIVLSVHEVFLNIYKPKIFDMIIEYPETQDFILEIKEALA